MPSGQPRPLGLQAAKAAWNAVKENPAVTKDKNEGVHPCKNSSSTCVVELAAVFFACVCEPIEGQLLADGL